MAFFSIPESSPARDYSPKPIADAIYFGTNYAISSASDIRCIDTSRLYNNFSSCPIANFCVCSKFPSKKPDVLLVSLFTAMVRLNHPMARDVPVDAT